jgi:hypothetical protein
MKNKKLTLLIALSILTIITLTLSLAPIAKSNVKAETEVEEELAEEAPQQPSIVEPEPEPEITIEEKEVVIKGEPAPTPVQPEPEPAIEEPITSGYSIPPVNTSFKSWMPYTAITNRASAQYKQQQYAYTDENGLRKIGDDYCVAMGTYYSSTIGERFKITMSTGAIFTVIISDIKSNRHTDSTHRYTARNSCMMEFLIDSPCLASCVRTSGNVGSLSLFSGQFVKVEKIS